MKKYLLINVLLINSIMASAATFCVTNESELRNALSVAESNNEFDTIKIQTGDYYTQGTEFSFDDNSGNGLDISGGWSFLPGPGSCGAQLSTSVLDTTIDGSSLSAAMSIDLSDEADLRVARLTFTNALSGDAALSIRKYNMNNVYLGHYIIEKNIFINNETSGFFGSALSVKGADKIEIRNNLVYKNLGNGSSIDISNPLGVEIYFTNNTIYKNEGYVFVELEGSSEMLVANNVIHRDTAGSSFFVSGGIWHLRNNNIKGLYLTPTSSVNNINLPSRFVNELGLDFRLDVTSPLIDKGFLPCAYTTQFCIIPIPFSHNWSLVETDLFYADRIQNDKVEIGAFEVDYPSDVIFMNLFD